MTRLMVSVALTVALVAGYTQVSAQVLNRGALVLISDNQSRLFVKVIAAVPGDTVSITDGRIAINGVCGDLTVAGGVNWGPDHFVSPSTLSWVPPWG